MPQGGLNKAAGNADARKTAWRRPQVGPKMPPNGPKVLQDDPSGRAGCAQIQLYNCSQRYPVELLSIESLLIGSFLAFRFLYSSALYFRRLNMTLINPKMVIAPIDPTDRSPGLSSSSSNLYILPPGPLASQILHYTYSSYT